MSEQSVSKHDLLTLILLLLGKKSMEAVNRSWIADQAWQYYLKHKTPENHKRYVKICKRLFPQ